MLFRAGRGYIITMAYMTRACIYYIIIECPMNIIIYVTVIILLFSSSATGDDPPTTSADLIKRARSECAGFNSGTFDVTEKAVTSHDITGDGRPEEFVDASQFACSTAASMWTGSGGTYLWVIVDNRSYEFLAHRWRVVDVDGQKIILVAVHSSECSDDIGPCYRAYVWQDGFRTTTRAYE